MPARRGFLASTREQFDLILLLDPPYRQGTLARCCRQVAG